MEGGGAKCKDMHVSGGGERMNKGGGGMHFFCINARHNLSTESALSFFPHVQLLFE